MTTPRVGAAPLLATLTLLTACEVVHERGVDSVAVVDTVRRVDTLVRQDTVRLPAAAPMNVAAAPAVGTQAPATALAGVPAQTYVAAGDVAPADPPLPAAPPAVSAADLAYLRGRGLLVPVAGVPASGLPNTFDEARGGGARRHDAIDILAPRGTPVLAADAGRVARLDTSAGGGLSLYATDPSGRFVYYYAHLDAYRPGLREGEPLARGDTLGTVGTTGNAPPDTPHLHFAITLLGAPRRWWEGTPINPWPLLTAAGP